MALDLRSLSDWIKEAVGRGRFSNGGPLGIPSHDPDGAPPQLDLATDRGGSRLGMVGSGEGLEHHHTERSQVRD